MGCNVKFEDGRYVATRQIKIGEFVYVDGRLLASSLPAPLPGDDSGPPAEPVPGGDE